MYTRKSTLSHSLCHRLSKMLLRMHTSMYALCSCTPPGYRFLCFSLMPLAHSLVLFSPSKTSFSSSSSMISPIFLERHEITAPLTLRRTAGGIRLINLYSSSQISCPLLGLFLTFRALVCTHIAFRKLASYFVVLYAFVYTLHHLYFRVRSFSSSTIHRNSVRIKLLLH